MSDSSAAGRILSLMRRRHGGPVRVPRYCPFCGARVFGRGAARKHCPPSPERPTERFCEVCGVCCETSTAARSHCREGKNG